MSKPTHSPRIRPRIKEATKANGLVAVGHDHTLLHRLFFGSVTRQLAHRVHIPMLVLHDRVRR